MAEKKTTVRKTTTTKTTATKKVPVKKVVKAAPVMEVEKCECKECSCGCNCEKKLNYILYLTAATLALVAILFGVVLTRTTVTSTTTEEESSYDVSMFEELTTTQAVEKIAKGDKLLIYIGRSNCGYCVKFLPNLQKAQKEFGYKTVYVDLNKVTGEDQEAWANFGGVARLYDESCTNADDVTEENKCGQFGLTPMVLVFENGKIKADWIGYSEYDQFASFLKENGFGK